MTRRLKIACAGVGIFAIIAAGSLYAWVHGYFDHGQFAIKQVQWLSPNQVAMLVERLNTEEALGGLEYYVLVGNHLFTPVELRRAYYSNSAVIFNTASNCVTLHWEGPNRLVITCNGSTIDRDQINAQRQRFGNIAISYEHIALK